MCSREIGGEALTLGASGWTYLSTFVLYDRETWTMWFPDAGARGLRGIAGRWADRVLPYRAFENTTWDVWVASHPDSKYLVVDR